MPRACPVELHVRCYKGHESQNFTRCHGLAPWSFTLAATKDMSHRISQDATGLPRGASRSLLQENRFQGVLLAPSVRLHGTSPWHLVRSLKRPRCSSEREAPRDKP